MYMVVNMQDIRHYAKKYALIEAVLDHLVMLLTYLISSYYNFEKNCVSLMS